VELSSSKGIPAFHVETADELEIDRLAEYETVGVTAGASTPNWIIQQVVERLEHAETRRPTGWKLAQRLLRFLTLTNLYIALGAAGLTLANMELLGQGFSPVYLVIAALYVFAVHTLNRLAEVKAGKLNDPNRSEFCQRHRGPLQASAMASGLGAIALSYGLGWGPLALTTLMLVIGGLYQTDLVRGTRANALKYRRLRDIPTSKTLFVPLAWAVITLILPALSTTVPVPWWHIGALSCMAFLLVFVRTTLLDIRDIQGDRLVGKETIPIVLGIKRTMPLLVGAIAILALLFIMAPFSGWLSPLHSSFLVGVGYLAAVAYLITHQRVRRRFLSESLVEGVFLVFGAIGLLMMLIRS
jgi:4-hydroxy-3-methylbut-2-enyl diphosphate reductase